MISTVIMAISTVAQVAAASEAGQSIKSTQVVVQTVDETPTDNRPVLWDKVRADMTIDEVRAFYPKDGKKIKWHKMKQTEVEDVVIIEGCEAEVEIQHESGRVDAVKVKGKGSLGGRCSDKVLSALSAKYGQPSITTNKRGSLFRRQGSTAVWGTQNGVTKRFKWFDSGMGGGGLGQASWELTYTGSSGEIAL